MSAGAVAVAFLVVARFEARHMRLHHAGAHHHKCVGAAATAALPFVERQFLDVGNEIGFPYPSLVKLGFSREIVSAAGVTVGEIVGVVEDEIFAGPLPQELRQVGDGKPPRRTRQAGVEELMPSVGWQYEVTAGSPLESLLCSRVAPDRGRSATGDNVDRLGVEMSQRRRGAPGWQLDDMLVAFIVSIQIREGAFDAVALAWPQSNFNRLHVFDVDTADQRRALTLAPLLIHIDTYDSRLLFRI